MRNLLLITQKDGYAYQDEKQGILYDMILLYSIQRIISRILVHT